MARTRGPQVTSSACVQRDPEGQCQGEWVPLCGPAHWLGGDNRGVGGSVCVCPEGGQAGKRVAGRGQGRSVTTTPVCPQTECHNPAYILGHLCLSSCPPRYFGEIRQAVTTVPPSRSSSSSSSSTSSVSTMRVCARCHPSCYTCLGGSPHNCTSCHPTYTLDERWGSCIKPATPHSQPRALTAATVGPRSPAQATLLALLAVAFGGTLISSHDLSVGCPPPPGGGTLLGTGVGPSSSYWFQLGNT